MSVDFNLSLEPQSNWCVSFPSKIAHRLPLYIEFIGDYHTLHDFYTTRDLQSSYMLMYTVSGQAALRYNDKDYILKEQSIFLVNCMKYHHFKPITTKWNYRWIHVNGESIRLYYDLLYSENTKVIYPRISLSISDMFDTLTALVKAPSVKSDLEIANTLTHFFTEIVANEISTTSIKNNEYVEKCIDYIANHYNDAINIDQLADLIYASKYHLINLFNRCLGISPYRYITEYRINQSKHLLLNTDMLVSEIATSVGFNSESHYIKLFTQHLGISPKQYKKSINKTIGT